MNCSSVLGVSLSNKSIAFVYFRVFFQILNQRVVKKKKELLLQNSDTDQLNPGINHTIQNYPLPTPPPPKKILNTELKNQRERTFTLFYVELFYLIRIFKRFGEFNVGVLLLTGQTIALNI